MNLLNIKNTITIETAQLNSNYSIVNKKNYFDKSLNKFVGSSS
jgi:hypothetical protein